MDRRIFDLETEYDVTCALPGQRPGAAPVLAALDAVRDPERLSPDEVARHLFRRMASQRGSSGGFLPSGARLWFDMRSRPEYATPECDNALDLVAHDKAGERILEDLLADADRRLREEGIAGDTYVFKHNADPAGRPYVCQENYLIDSRGEFGMLADILIPFLVTRQVICGTGTVLRGPQGAVYCVSQRADHIWETVSSETIRRAIITTGDGPQVDVERFRRLHVTVGDANMSETTTLLKVGATDLVLRMIEAGTVMGDLTLDNPIRAIRDVSHDITGRRFRVRLASGREMTAVQIQYEYLSRAKDFTERDGLDATGARVLDMWQRALGAIEDGDLDKIAREIDWVIKYQLIERYRASHDLPLASPQVAQLDLAYHDVHRGRGEYYLLQRSGAVDRVVRDLDIFEAKSVPPHGHPPI